MGVVNPYTHFYKFDMLTSATSRLIFNSLKRSRGIERGADRFWTWLFLHNSRIPVMLFGTFYIKTVHNHVLYISGPVVPDRSGSVLLIRVVAG